MAIENLLGENRFGENLLDEFAPISTAAWEEAIARDLKGADYTKKLVWQTDEGLAVKPYYRAEDLAELPPPVVHANTPWRIREEVDATDPEQANRAAINAVAAGAEEIAFHNVVVCNTSDLGLLLANLQEIPVHFPNAGEPLLRLLIERLKTRHDQAQVSTGFNPLANLDFAPEVLLTAPAALVPFTIDSSELEEAGATAVEEIGFTLAAAVDFLAEMQSRHVDLNRAAAAVAFSFAIGSNYFFQIAKFRAFRSLWARALESFAVNTTDLPVRIHARTSRWNKTIYDPHVNVLRATTEAMSAILGGVSSLSVAPFDECYKSPDESSRRLARNTQIILKRESLLAHVSDPGAGSYCIELITDFLAREGWSSMQKIEAAGGYRKALAAGHIRHTLDHSLAAKEKAVHSRRRVFTGTNQFADPSHRVLECIDPLHLPAVRRGAQSFERIRLRTERHAASTGNLPRVLLAEFGDPKMRSARSTFAANFFACAGFEIVEQHFTSAQEIAATEADLIVLCSSDEEYLESATALLAHFNTLGRKTPVIVAGNPESAEQLLSAGVADFIHVRTNPIDALTKWQNHLGIKA
jgi:methylmalonyl-CoA mutase